MTMKHFGPTKLDAALIPKIAEQWGTPIYLHDQEYIENSCRQLLGMPKAAATRPRSSTSRRLRQKRDRKSVV